MNMCSITFQCMYGFGICYNKEQLVYSNTFDQKTKLLFGVVLVALTYGHMVMKIQMLIKDHIALYSSYSRSRYRAADRWRDPKREARCLSVHNA